MLVYELKLKIFNSFSASDIVRVKLQHLYTIAKVLRVFHIFINIVSVLAVFTSVPNLFISLSNTFARFDLHSVNVQCEF